jgi:hypothetical protein
VIRLQLRVSFCLLAAWHRSFTRAAGKLHSNTQQTGGAFVLLLCGWHWQQHKRHSPEVLLMAMLK